MASAISATRNEQKWGNTKVLMKNYPPNPSHNFSNVSNFASRFNTNPSFIASENSRFLLNNDQKRSHKSHIASRTLSNNVDGRDLYGTKFVSFDLASFDRCRLKELKNRLIMELRCVRGIIRKIESREIVQKPSVSMPKSHKVLGQKRRRALDSPLSKAMRKCREALLKLMNLKSAVPFNQPVDVEVLQLPDYNLIIKRPMDLGTIKSKLAKSRYRTPRAFASDVRLTFENAMLYNLKGSKVYVSAEKLLSRFEQLFDPISKSFDALCPDFKHSAKSVPKLSNVGLQSRREMRMEEKEELVERLQEMPPEVASRMVYILRGRNPDLMVEGDEIELDMEALDAETLWELERFVANYTNGMKKKPKEDCTVIEIEPDDAEMDKKGGEVEEDVDIAEEILVGDFPSVQIEKDVAGPKNSGSSSSSSSSDSDSQSSSDSDSSSLSSGEEDGVGTPFVEQEIEAPGMDAV